MKHDFRYVSRNEAKEVKKDLLDIIHEVQNIVRDDFTFSYWFVGSSERNMITYDAKSNIGFDFDVNIQVNDDYEEYTPAEIKRIIRLAFDKVVCKYRYDYCEDSTRVLTIKFKDRKHSRILHSCDFAIVYNCVDGRQQYIRFNKEQQSYAWEYQPKGYKMLLEKIEWLKSNRLWNDLLDYYIEKKNNNFNPDKHSRAIFSEAVTEMCQKNGFYTNRKK